jgi:hypothetical protein
MMDKKTLYADSLKRALSFAVSDCSLKEKLDFVVRTTSESVGGGVSLILLDSCGLQLITAL